MKRHIALTPLSREHHSALILAQLLKKDAPVYKGLPQTAKEKAIYATAFFEKDLKAHFEKEEAVFGLVKMVHPGIEKMINELVAEHRDLSDMFHSLTDTVPQDLIEKMNSIGELLKPEKKETLSDILQYHVSVGVFKTEAMTDGQIIGQVNGDNIIISKKDGKIIINGNATIVATVPASNGIVYVIDKVLLPPVKK